MTMSDAETTTTDGYATAADEEVESSSGSRSASRSSSLSASRSSSFEAAVSGGVGGGSVSVSNSLDAAAAADGAPSSPPRYGTRAGLPAADKTPRTANARGGRGEAEREKSGVAVDVLTASLLGIDFLPFAADSRSSSAEYAGNSASALSAASAVGTPPAIPALTHSADEDDDDGGVDDNSTLTDDPLQPSRSKYGAVGRGGRGFGGTKKRRRRKIKGAFRSIKKSIVGKNGSSGSSSLDNYQNIGGSGASYHYQHPIPAAKDLEREFAGQSAAATISRSTSIAASANAAAASNDPWVDQLTADLTKLKCTAQSASDRASALHVRIQRHCHEIETLEKRLMASRRVLAGDMAELDALAKEMEEEGGTSTSRGMRGLEEQKVAMEGRVVEMEGRARAVLAKSATSASASASTSPVPVPLSARSVSGGPPRPPLNLQQQKQQQRKQLQLQQKPRPKTVKKLSSFIRIHDLDLAQDVQQLANDDDGRPIGTPAADGTTTSIDTAGAAGVAAPQQQGSAFPLSVQMNKVKSGSARPDLADIGSTIAPAIVEALARMAYDAATDDSTSRWTPSPDTKKMLSKRSSSQETSVTSTSSNNNGLAKNWIHVPNSDVYVWYSKFDHGGFGADLPVVKARGIVSCSAQSLVSLLLDSSRTKEYNKMSIGRTDEHYFHRNSLPGVTDGDDENYGGSDDDENLDEGQDAWNDLPGETRILRALSKPPMVRKPIEIVTLYHARELDSVAGQVDGYLVVSRSIWESEDIVPSKGGGGGGNASESSRPEMLLGAQLIRTVKDDECELTTINHISSKSIPLMLAKKVGLMTAANFIIDIQVLMAGCR